MNSRERVERALNHGETDRMPVDFRSTGVTGISASVVNKLWKYFGLDSSSPVKVIKPYQILGEIADDLKQKLWVDCIGIGGKNNLFGYENDNWKEWKLFGRTPVDLVFWGGGVDTQKILPFGTPEEVREEVEKNLEIIL